MLKTWFTLILFFIFASLILSCSKQETKSITAKAEKGIIVLQVIAIVAVVIVLFTPGTIFYYNLKIVIAIASFYGLIVITWAMIRKRDYAHVFFIGFLILFLAIINDLLLFEGIINTYSVGSF